MPITPERVRERNCSAVLIRLPSSSVTRTDGIVIVGSVPPSPVGGPPATLSTTITAFAPASWAFLTLTANPQTPRSTSAMLPATASAFSASSGLQARPVPFA